MSAPHLDRLFVERARDYLANEYPAKLRITVNALPPDKLWWRPNQDSNSVGNLLLHLNGNLRQWIVEGVGGEAYARHRAEEFAAREGRPASELLADLERTLADIDRILSGLSAERLAERCAIQGRDLTVLDAIFHVTEHFAYHLGQIILVAKMFAPGGIHFYEDAGGLARPLWHPNP
ncbi:MAG TPA: DinB family protein [Vicinamibacterales bacterium]